jgi:hypothetical protein
MPARIMACAARSPVDGFPAWMWSCCPAACRSAQLDKQVVMNAGQAAGRGETPVIDARETQVCVHAPGDEPAPP